MQSSCGKNGTLRGFQLHFFDEKTLDAFDVGAHKQTTTLSGQGRWSLITAQTGPMEMAPQVIEGSGSYHFMLTTEAWAQESLPRVSPGQQGQRSGSWYR